MFANAYQSGFLSIFYSVGSNPLALWDKEVKNGHIRRIIDDEVKSLVLDIGGTNVATTYITCPLQPRASLGIKLPFLVMIIKNMKKYFSFEIQILDDKDMRRRFRVSNFQSTTKVRPFCTTMPIGLSSGWNQVQFNLADFTKRAYGSQYMETVRVQVHANVRIRRIYFTDQLHSDEDLPNEFKLFAPSSLNVAQKSTKAVSKVKSKEAVAVEKPKEQDEEVPPPPTPAEETARETEPEEPEVAEHVEETPHEEHPAEEHPSEEGPPVEGEEAVAPVEDAEGEPVAEGEAPPEGEPVPEGEAPVEGAEGEVAAPEGEEAPAEGEAPPVEAEAPPAEGEAPAEAEPKEEPAEAAAPEEPPAEAPAEAEPPAAELESPSEPPTDAEPPTEEE